MLHKPNVVAIRGKDAPTSERELMKLLLDLEQRIVACEQVLGLGESEERPRLKLVKGRQR